MFHTFNTPIMNDINLLRAIFSYVLGRDMNSRNIADRIEAQSIIYMLEALDEDKSDLSGDDYNLTILGVMSHNLDLILKQHDGRYKEIFKPVQLEEKIKKSCDYIKSYLSKKATNISDWQCLFRMATSHYIITYEQDSISINRLDMLCYRASCYINNMARKTDKHIR